MSGAMKCSPIYLENIFTTIDSIKRTIFEPLNISSEHWTSDIGSVGKKPVSGDIDIAIDVDYCDTNIFTEYLKKNGFDFKKTGGAIANIAFPIEGTQKGEYVQVDFFDLLGILIKYCTLLINEKENKVSYISLKQDGAYKTIRLVDNSNIRIGEDVLITNKPEELIKIVFGDKYNVKHFNSVESIITLMMDDDFQYKYIIDEVFRRFEEIEEKKGRELPNMR